MKLKDKISLVTFMFIISINSYCGNNKECVIEDEQSKLTITSTSPTLTTSDGFLIATTYNIPDVNTDKIPGIILIHQGTSSKAEWVTNALILNNQGYATLAIDLRGHGSSTAVSNLNALFSDPEQTPKDILVAIEFLRVDPLIDSNRLAIVGSSIGGELACVASSQYNIKTAVAFSADMNYVTKLHVDKMKLRSIFHVGAVNDVNQTAKALYDITSEPRKIYIHENSAIHGTRLFSVIESQVLDWLNTNL